MADSRIEKLAALLINYSLELKAGEKLIIEGTSVSLPLITELYREAIRVGAYPEYKIGLSNLTEIMLKNGNNEQLTFLSKTEEGFYSNYDCYITIWGDYSTKPFASVNSEKITTRRRARKDLSTKFFERIASKDARWVGTLYPNFASAQDADKSYEDFEEFVYKAGMLHLDNPVEHWQNVSKKQQKICDYLTTKQNFRFISDGTDLTLSTKDRLWINCDGKENFPDGEVFSSPIENSVNGKIRFSYPAVYSGKEVEDVTLYFENGRVVNATALKNQEFLNTILDTDECSRLVGEIAIGTNYGIKEFSKDILFDEKIGGTIHLAVGASILEAGGVNNSSIHWDMICDMRNGGKIYADDELIYENGEFLVEFK